MRHAWDWKRLAGWTLFAAAFGFTEATTVVYLRRLLGMAPGLDYRQLLAAHGLSPGLFAGELQRHDLLGLEAAREAATLLLLAGAAWGGGRSRREQGGILGWTFAAWDLSYYLFLRLLIGFPHSLTSTDIYFLLPIASYGPVWFPVLVVMPLLAALSLRLLRTPG